jgi:hypothetical protein
MTHRLVDGPQNPTRRRFGIFSQRHTLYALSERRRNIAILLGENFEVLKMERKILRLL